MSRIIKPPGLTLFEIRIMVDDKQQAVCTVLNAKVPVNALVLARILSGVLTSVLNGAGGPTDEKTESSSNSPVAS